MKLTRTPDGGAGLNADRGFDFVELPECKAVLFAGGSYRTTKLYARGGSVFVRYGSGFLKLHSHGTSNDKVRVEALYLAPGIIYQHDEMGRLTVTPPTITIEHDRARKAA